MGNRALTIAIAFSATLIFTGYLRLAGLQSGPLADFAGFATPLYVGATVVFALALGRAGVDLNRFGLGFKLRVSHVVLATIGVGVLQAYAAYGYPYVAGALEHYGLAGADRAGERFGSAQGSVRDALTLLAFSWSFAALGEEIAFRIVLLRGLIAGLGGGALATFVAIVVQAVVFGLVHFYKGGPGMASSMISGLVFATLVVAARGAIWPAFLAHGVNNTIGIWRLYGDG